MAFDGIITWAITRELKEKLNMGKIEKVYQPEKDQLVFNIHTKNGNKKLFASVSSSNSRVNIIDESLINPPVPLSFCMLLRKHLQGGRIVDIKQKNSERIIEISVETLNELGFSVTKKIIVEIMGKHSNIILVDTAENRIVDSIKRVSIDVNRIRQILPGKEYEYPPEQDKIPFKEIDKETLNNISADSKSILSSVGGISPAVATEISLKHDFGEFLNNIIQSVEDCNYIPRVYVDKDGVPREFHITDLTEYEQSCERIDFHDLSSAINYYFDHKTVSNRARQKSHDLEKAVLNHLDKLYLKKQRLSEDLLTAQNSDELRLFGELLTANLHLVKPGAEAVKVSNYYDGNTVVIPLDKRHSAAKNAQDYFKKYGKMKTAIKEKQIQIDDCKEEIIYLESVISFLENTDDVENIEALRNELSETGYIRKKKTNFKGKKYKPQPHKYITSDGFTILVGRNNKENDILTTRTAERNDYWLHTKDIPGSHVVIKADGKEISDQAIIEAAAIAAYHSKGRTSENVPVDYVLAKFVKKPAGAKPGMVIFTNNNTIWINPKLPEDKSK